MWLISFAVVTCLTRTIYGRRTYCATRAPCTASMLLQPRSSGMCCRHGGRPVAKMRDDSDSANLRAPKAAWNSALVAGLLTPLRALAETTQSNAAVQPNDALSNDAVNNVLSNGQQGLVLLGLGGIVVVILKGLAVLLGGGYLASLGERLIEEGDSKESFDKRLTRILGIPYDEPAEFLKIERLNDRLESYDYSFKKATVSKAAALRTQKAHALQRRLGIDFSSFDLDTATIKKVEEAAKKFRNKDENIREKLSSHLSSVRSDLLKKDADDIMSSLPFIGVEGAGKTAKLQEDLFKAEIQFLNDLRDALPAANASAIAEIFKPSFSADLGSYVKPGSLDLNDALAALQEAKAPSDRKHVWVLEFFGDIEASQVKDLRKEVTAVIRSASSKRGDEVVLVLNTGGGTVVGYGLAGAQLERIKNAGLHLTICVEQVAASGGYLMGCVADEIIAAPFAVLGSVGVITEIPNVYERLQKEGVFFKTATAGKFKRTITPTKKITREDEKKLEEDLEKILAIFKGWVERNRPTLDIEKVATGETWFGPDALKMKLVDRLATVDDVLLEHVDEGSEVFSVKASEPKQQLGLFGSSSNLQDGLDFLEQSGQRDIALSFLKRLLSRKPGKYDWLQSQDTMPKLTDTDLEYWKQKALMKRPEGAPEPLFYSEVGDERRGKTWDGF